MKVTCQGCKKTFKVADEKIPANKEVKVRCPACRTIIKISRPADEAGAAVDSSGQGELTGKPLIDHIVKTSKAMPPMPQILARATEIIDDETKGFQDIAEVLETDQAMATRVLRIANSAFYGLTVPASSVRQASALLGSQTLLELITIVSTSKIMGQALDGYGYSSVNVWKHSLCVAVVSRKLAELKFPELLSDAFNAGLIHDSGMVILDEYMAARKNSQHAPTSDENTLIETEKALFGFDHAELASEFLTKWNLPAAQTHAIRYHHQPSASDGDNLAHILHAAECLCQEGADADQATASAESGTFEHLGMDKQDIENLHNEAMEAVEEIISNYSR